MLRKRSKAYHLGLMPSLIVISVIGATFDVAHSQDGLCDPTNGTIIFGTSATQVTHQEYNHSHYQMPNNFPSLGGLQVTYRADICAHVDP
jgi:hypothetical protein